MWRLDALHSLAVAANIRDLRAPTAVAILGDSIGTVQATRLHVYRPSDARLACEPMTAYRYSTVDLKESARRARPCGCTAVAVSLEKLVRIHHGRRTFPRRQTGITLRVDMGVM